MTTVTKKNGYLSEVQELHHRRVYYILLLGIALMLSFSFLDYILVPSYFYEFLVYRLIVCGCALLLVAANYYDCQKRWSLAIGLLGYVFAGTVILIMIHKMGGTQSPYYVGLIVIMTIYTTLTPLTLSQTLVSGFLLIAGYLLAVISGELLITVQPLWVFSNFFFMFCFVCIAATQSATETNARKFEYNLRQQEQRAALDLQKQAENLEKEVSQRTTQIKLSEQKYQLLFNSLADDVVLVNPFGMILQANAAFIRHFGSEVVTEKHSIFDIMPVEKRVELQHILDAVITSESSFSAYQVDLALKEKGQCTIEITASLLKREGKRVGVQLVLRDISVRLDLERRLVDSLKTVRSTEEAAILALAKLSEYREMRSGNHLERIREFCKVIAQGVVNESDSMGSVTSVFVDDIYHASVLHDIGKVTISDTLLRKTEPLTALECDIIRNHTLAGGDVIKDMEAEGHGSGFLAMAKSIAYFHHERWDGKGYPHGLIGTEIPLAARILSVADEYEEMTRYHGVGHRRLDHEEVLVEIMNNSGKAFDPVVVKVVVNCEQKMDEIRVHFARRQVDHEPI